MSPQLSPQLSLQPHFKNETYTIFTTHLSPLFTAFEHIDGTPI